MALNDLLLKNAGLINIKSLACHILFISLCVNYHRPVDLANKSSCLQAFWIFKFNAHIIDQLLPFRAANV